MPHVSIQNTAVDDLPLIYQMFEESVRYQEARGYPSWKNYDKASLERDVANGNQYKVIIDSKIAIVFSVCYSDNVIWRQREQGDAVYLHRIVVNPSFKGQRLFGEILNWTIEHAKEKKLHYVRMDTWANNPNLVNYYLGFGFRYVEDYTTPDTNELPVHNRNLSLALLELSL